jgi:hypothetical protein
VHATLLLWQFAYCQLNVDTNMFCFVLFLLTTAIVGGSEERWKVSDS